MNYGISMARPFRLEFSGTLYPITSRDDGRDDIGWNDDDREWFLALLGEVCPENRVKLR